MLVIETIADTAPTQGRPLLISLAGVVIDHVEDYLQPSLMTGHHQLAHLLASLQRVVPLQVARVRCHPTDRAVTPVVDPPRGRVVGIEGHYRQQLDRGHPQLLEIGQRLDQPWQGALLRARHRAAAAAGEAPHVQFVDNSALPAVARPGGGGKVEALPLGHHPLETAGGVGGGAHGGAAAIAIPSGDGPGTGIQQHLGGIEAVAARLQRSKHPIAITTAEADALHLHVPVVGGAMPLIQLDHPLGLAGFPRGEQQQLHPRGLGGHQGEIHPPSGDAGAQGSGAADPDRRSWGGQGAGRVGP